ncbi:MAG: hypothetical protein M3N45_09270 [Actinomycetota bacterium]|nr:hypothetical protein [Actinomycetota bacterium]
MTEQTTTDETAFGRVLAALMEARSIPAEPEQVKALAERSGLGPEALVARVLSAKGPRLGDLTPLARELGLSELEMRQLALAYVFEETYPCYAPGCERPAIVGDEFRGCEGHRAAYDARAEVEAWDLARKILGPWVEAARPIGSDELTAVMEKALAEVEQTVAAAHDKLERAEAGADV